MAATLSDWLSILVGAAAGMLSLGILTGQVAMDMWLSPVLGVLAIVLLYYGLKDPQYHNDTWD